MVIASSNWIQNASSINQEKGMSATGILICHDNSYPFQERTLSLEQPIKIGRSVARARATNDNAIFDCKVLSRNHALLWYDTGKFYLKDTKSSNGTFVNNKRLSPSGEESVACEVCSGDVVQFGVDVVESTKKVTHGCIVATLKLYLPDGKEAKASFTNSVAYVNVTLEDLYKLHQFIQDAGRRENALRSKLEYMQQLLEHTRIATNQSWKALVLEDCLLSRLEMLENQVLVYSKNYGEDKLRMELITLLEDKSQYQNATKDLLQKKVQEKREIVGKIQILKSRLSETEEETQTLHSIIKNNQNELQELAIKYVKVQQTLQDTTDKLNKTKTKLKEIIQQSEKEKKEFLKKLEDGKIIEKDLQIDLKDSKLDSIHIYKQINALKNYMQTIQDIKFIKDEAHEFDNFAQPIDAVNIILNKRNSIFLKIINNQNTISEDEVCFTDKNEKFLSSTYFSNNLKKSDLYNNLSVLENKYKYILPPEYNKTFTTAAIKSENDFVSSCSLNLYNEKELNIPSYAEDESTFSKNENSSPIKLMMRLTNNKSDNPNENTIQSNNEILTDFVESENFCNSLSRQIIKSSEETHNTIEIIKDTYSEQEELNVEDINLQNNHLTNTSKPFVSNNVTISKGSQQLILKNLIKSTKLLKKDYFHNNQNIILEELQDLKNWLSHEPNDVIINKLKNYYNQIENESQHVQELNEQLVILKEKYNTTIEEKANIVRKCITLEAQCKDFLNTTYMISIYYIVPIIFVLFWMLLEKIL